MGSFGSFAIAIALVSITIWVGLLTVWGRFWHCDQQLIGDQRFTGDQGFIGDQQLTSDQRFTGDQGFTDDQRFPEQTASPLNADALARAADSTPLPVICAIIPARNEADVLPMTVRSLLRQTYAGKFQIILVDDQSTDGTAEVARQTAAALGRSSALTVINAEPLPAGWTGKLWAMEQGVRYIKTLETLPDYVLFTDADIAHDSGNLNRLVTKAQQDDLDLVSLMVLLRCQSVWEKFLIPAFVFFFQKLYPFPWVNNPKSRVAAAAGGCILIRLTVLEQIGGLQILRQALIDDCSLAIAVKKHGNGKIWLGLTQTTLSLRPYDSLKTIWDMVARTAYTQLGYSPLLLGGTVFGMALVYLVSPIAAIVGLGTMNWILCGMGLLGWGLMTIAYLPTIRLYQLAPLWAICLPAIALLYNLMTIDSALRHWRGQGGAWKGRVYPQT
jgi:hopene-associated glycosyltransferase HpnB